MASRFWVLGTGTWDASDTSHWAATSGGAPLASVPGSGDTVTFDASSGGGTVTVNTTVNVTSITAGAFTGTLDFAANNNNVTASTVSFSGTGTRTINMGSGTWTVTGAGTSFDVTTVTNLTASFASATVLLSGTIATTRTFAGGGKSYGTLSIATNTSRGPVQFTGANTFANLALAAGTTVTWPSGTTNTITNAPTLTGTSSNPIAFLSGSFAASTTISCASGAFSFDWGAFLRVGFSGGATFSATNSLDLGLNTGITITPPSAGAGVQGSRIRLGM